MLARRPALFGMPIPLPYVTRLPGPRAAAPSWRHLKLALPFVLEMRSLRGFAAVSSMFRELVHAPQSWSGLTVDFAVTSHPSEDQLARCAALWCGVAVVRLDLRDCPSARAAAAVAEALQAARLEVIAPRGFHKLAMGRLVELGRDSTVAAIRGHDARSPACLSVASYCCGAVTMADAPLCGVASPAHTGARVVEFEALGACAEPRCQRGLRVGITPSFPKQLGDQLRGVWGMQDSIHMVRNCLYVSVTGDLAWRDCHGAHHLLGRHPRWNRQWRPGDRLHLRLSGRRFDIRVNGITAVTANIPASLVPDAKLQASWWALLDLSRGVHSAALCA